MLSSSYLIMATTNILVTCSVVFVDMETKIKKTYFVHRFVWECFNGLIPDNRVIDHINDNKEDNRLCNLQLTQQQNCRKAAKKRDYTFAANNFQNRRYVKAISQTTQQVVYFNSMYVTQKHLGINGGIVKMVCEGISNCKTGISIKDGHHYKFEYVRNEDMPDDYKKSANRRPRKVSDEDKKKVFKRVYGKMAKKKIHLSKVQ